MTRLHNDGAAFADEALAGFVVAHPDHVRAVPGGVVRRDPTPSGQVAVVLGGGTGHYPAFAGWVGTGFAHGAACGNVFASPSASQVASVARACEAGGGVVLGYGNYAGDVLHFGLAAERLRAEGIDVRTLAVTDDIASARPDEAHRRRGVAGDLPVFKILAAAAEEGMSLDDVEAVGNRANDATRSFGIAVSGCTLPGAPRPLFTVPDGRIALGLGIHGEPGVDEVEHLSADAVADLLVERVLAEEPPRGGHDAYDGRVAVVLNGLGTVKYEELFVVHRRVAQRLAEAGLTTVRPEVGEHVTSLDMAGVSLSIVFLTDELERLWLAPADAPAYRRHSAVVTEGSPSDRASDASPTAAGTVAGTALPPASEQSRATARRIALALDVARDTIVAHEQRLGDIDAVAGDGDHGIGMVRGVTAAAAAARDLLHRGAGARSLLLGAAEAWAERAGGTSGALWGAALTALSCELDDVVDLTPAAVSSGVQAGVDAVVRLGGAALGDKTMVDAARPFADAFAAGVAGGADLATAGRSAAEESTAAAEATADLVASLGRARTHGDRSLGTPDAGAISFALIVTAVTDALSDPS